MEGVLLDTRPRAAVYSWYRNKRERRAVELLRAFCAVSGLLPTFYLDRKAPRRGQPPPLWQCLCRDVEAGKYAVVITWLDVPGMGEWCEAVGVRYEQVDPFEFSVAIRANSMLR